MRFSRISRFATITFLALLTLSLGCSKSQQDPSTPYTPPTVETFPIANSELKNCRFAQSPAVYTLGSAIRPNVVSCDEGVPKKMEVLNPAALPAGLELDLETLALVGTPRERVSGAPFTIYLENESGYVRIPLTITVR